MQWADLKESDQSSSAGRSRVTSPTDKYGDVTHPRYDQATADNGTYGDYEAVASAAYPAEPVASFHAVLLQFHILLNSDSVGDMNHPFDIPPNA